MRPASHCRVDALLRAIYAAARPAGAGRRLAQDGSPVGTRSSIREELLNVPKERLAAFSDGVIAIIITIMVLELKVPHGADWAAIAPLLPIFLSYILSFVYLAIYWNNHHHMIHTVRRVNGAILWANMHLLFWLSLIPFATGWMGENSFARLPTALYGVALLMPAIAYYLLEITIIRHEGPDGALARAVGHEIKGKVSPFLYLTAIGFAFVLPYVSYAIYVLVALMWLVPDRRIEKAVRE
jgi:TMEM175 potassium channel family protein